MTPERLAEIREADHRDHARGTVAPSQVPDIVAHRAELLAEVDRLTTELAKTHDDSAFLAALEEAGVDNWQGYDMARQIQHEADSKTGTHTYAVDVFYMDNNHWFGPDGWTWCPVIDGEPHDNTSDLPHCADEADARAKADAWLASKQATAPAAADGQTSDQSH